MQPWLIDVSRINIIIVPITHAGPSPPRGVQTFCLAVGWRVPLNPNGKIIGYDVQLMRPGSDVMLLSTDSDSTFLAIENDYQLVGTTVQVGVKRCIYMRKISVNILIIEYACRSVLKLQLGQEIGVKNYH